MTTLLTVGNVCGLVDENANGMSDVWERKFQVVDADPLADPDLDGQNNLLESIAGTDPNDSGSVLSIEHTEYSANSALVSWQSYRGQRYQLERSSSLSTTGWVNEGGVMIGTGGMMLARAAQTGDLHRFYRVVALSGQSTLLQDAAASITHDTDGDGLSDISEIKLGYDPFDAQSHWRAPGISFGASLVISWSSSEGKIYRLQSRSALPGSEWEYDGEALPGTGEPMVVTSVRTDSAQREYRVLVEDVDTDGDGLTDWEELQVGYNPQHEKTDPLGPGDWLAMQELLTADNVVSVKAKEAVANITRMEDGAFELIRTGGLDALQVAYTVGGTAVAGSDYESLSGTVTMPFGQNSVVIPVKPLASSSLSLSESVVVTLQDLSTYDPGVQDSQQINVIREVAINVRDHGAVGDGVTDDTLAIQAALEALEASNTHNTLHFPTGQYRLNQLTRDYYTISSLWRILTFGASDLAGRDIVFSGDIGSSLYSTVSPTRAHIMVAIASFRSLTCRGVTWEKDSVPLSEKAGGEPNGADGISLVAEDSRIVEHVKFHGCKFINCHGALMITANGFDRRGHLRQLGFYHCDLLNPFGANTENSTSAWGGGQQTYISQWVGDAIYKGNVFEGGGADMTDTTTSPGGCLKDAAVIGGPQRLIFQDNIVRRMGIEAVFHNGRAGWMSQSLTSFTIPPADGVTVSTVDVLDIPTTFEPGQIIIMHTPTTATVEGKDSVFRVTAYDAINRRVSLVNDGYIINADPGMSIPLRADIYLDTATPLPLSRIENNLIEGYFPPGSDDIAYSVGITMNTHALVRGNVIKGYVVGVMSYKERMPHPWSRGLMVDSNIILARDSAQDIPFGVMGVRSWAKDQEISRNIVMAPLSRKFAGIVAYGDGALIQDNWVIAMQVERHDYTSGLRSLGVGIGNSGINTVFEGNRTFGFDVGCGPAGASQSIPHRVISHYSLNDTLPVDPRGVIPE